MKNKVYKPIVKKFLGYDVKVINVDQRNEYIVCKDIFDVLGLTDKDGKWNKPKKKMLDFLDGIGENSGWKTFPLRVKDKHAKQGQVREVDCINIEVVPIILTQFQPTKRRGEDALNRWFDFMKFVNMLLETYSANKYIFETKKTQVQAQDEIHDDGGEPMKMNLHVNQIMGYVLQMEDGKAVKKSEIYQFQNRITEDVGKVRDDILTTYVNTFKVIGDQSKAYGLTLKWALKKYVK